MCAQAFTVWQKIYITAIFAELMSASVLMSSAWMDFLSIPALEMTAHKLVDLPCMSSYSICLPAYHPVVQSQIHNSNHHTLSHLPC